MAEILSANSCASVDYLLSWIYYRLRTPDNIYNVESVLQTNYGHEVKVAIRENNKNNGLSSMSHWKNRKTIINAKTLIILVDVNVEVITYLSDFEPRFHY